MIPYLQIPPIVVFDYPLIHPFGILVATGILAGAALTVRRGVRLGLQEEMIKNMIFWSLLCGFLLSHILDVIVYQDHPTFLATLKAIADPRTGLSSMFGFAGAVLGLVLWCRHHKEPILPYADSLAYGLAVGWMFGRLGCTVAHDHPGERTTFFLGMDYPCPNAHCPNVPGEIIHTGAEFRRHDMGFYEVLIAGALAAFYWLAEHFYKPRLGFFVAAIATYYGPVRFALDFLRVKDIPSADPRFFNLTPAHYAAIVVTIVGLVLIVRVQKIPANRPAAIPSEASPEPSSSSDPAAPA